MGQVYKYAFCTISANISDASQSILLPKEDQPDKGRGWLSKLIPGRHPVSMSPPPAVPPVPRIREPVARSWFDNSYVSEWDKTLEGGPLGNRGWCLQERHLSPRVFHVIDDGLWIWECNSRAMASDGSKREGPPRRLRVIDIVVTGIHSSESKFKIWYDIVGDYSKRDLTYKSDKFTALSGIVHALQKDNGSCYSAGLWTDDMTHGLLWKRDTRAGSPQWKRCLESQAPSWSWCSIDGPVQFEYHGGLRPLIKITDIKVLLSSEDYAGQIKIGSKLTVSALVLKASVTGVHAKPAFSYIEPSVEDRTASMPSGEVCFDHPSEVIPPGETVWCLIVAAAETNPEWRFGLALLPIGGSLSVVRRVGMVEVYNISNWRENGVSEMKVTII
jgi:hypothetical protein